MSFCITASKISAADDNPAVHGFYSGGGEAITSPVLSIVSLNIAHGREDAWNQIFLGADKIRANLRHVGTILNSAEPHIVSLQEADGPSIWSGGFDHVAFLAEQLGLPFHAGTRHSSTPLFQFGTAFISRVPLQNVHAVRFSPSPPTLRKGFLMAAVPWNPGGGLARPVSVNIVSVHLDFSRRSVRSSQAHTLVESLSSVSRPLILSGDFNSDWGGDDPTVRNIARELGLHVFEPGSHSLGTNPATGKRLDWVMISQDLEFRSYSIIPDIVSDHLAISTTIGLGTEP